MLVVSILGEPQNDNALLVVSSDGKAMSRILIDCGADTLRSLAYADIQAIDHLFLSHLHMDHVSGFDAFFRINFNTTFGTTKRHIHDGTFVGH